MTTDTKTVRMLHGPASKAAATHLQHHGFDVLSVSAEIFDAAQELAQRLGFTDAEETLARVREATTEPQPFRPGQWAVINVPGEYRRNGQVCRVVKSPGHDHDVDLHTGLDCVSGFSRAEVRHATPDEIAVAALTGRLIVPPDLAVPEPARTLVQALAEVQDDVAYLRAQAVAYLLVQGHESVSFAYRRAAEKIEASLSGVKPHLQSVAPKGVPVQAVRELAASLRSSANDQQRRYADLGRQAYAVAAAAYDAAAELVEALLRDEKSG